MKNHSKHQSRNWRLIFGSCLLCVAGAVQVAVAALQNSAPITLGWNPAPDPSVTGYAIYYGPTNQPATNRINAAANLAYTFYNLQANLGYRFYAVSYNAAGVESPPSNQVSITPKILGTLRLARQSDGSMRLTAKAAPGTVCNILWAATPNATQWQILNSVTADLVGAVVGQDLTARFASSRFYRVQALSQP